MEVAGARSINHCLTPVMQQEAAATKTERGGTKTEATAAAEMKEVEAAKTAGAATAMREAVASVVPVNHELHSNALAMTEGVATAKTVESTMELLF